jgi:glucosamine kinase
MSLLIGVDAGASHTEAVAADGDLNELGRESGAAGAVRPGAERESARVILDVSSRALRAAGAPGPPDAAVIGSAGAGHAEEQRALAAALSAEWKATIVQVVTDGEIALAAAFGKGPGILLAAGTGSIAFARNSTGELRRVGGLGWRHGDEGSSYALASGALRAVGRAADGRDIQTGLMERLLEATGTDSIEELSQWARTAEHTEVAALAPNVLDAAQAGDLSARDLVQQAAIDLALHVAALLPMFTGESRVPLALSGGLIQAGSPVRDLLVEIIRHDMPAVEIGEAAVDPAFGAVRMAAELLEVT